MAESKNWTKYPTLFSLYIAQSVPMSFFSTVVPVIMRQENYSLESIGLLQLVKLPWILKFFWAPLVDNQAKNTKDLKRWIVFSELFYALIITSIAFLSLQTDFKLIVVLMVVAFIASATQDIATDAFSILILKKEERGVGNSMQTAGSFVGALLGTGVLLIAYSFFGWSAFLFMLAGFVLFALIPLKLYKVNRTIKKRAGYRVSLLEIGRFFRIPGIPRRVFILVFYYSGFIGLLTMLKPFLVDLGYNIKEIGFMSGIVGTSFATGSALLVGAMIKKTGRNRIMIALTLLGITSAAYFWFIAGGTPSLLQVYIGICLVWCTYGASSVIIYTTSMDVVRPGAAGTDFTVQIVITHLSSLVVAVLSGKVAGMLGYEGLFGIEVLLGILTLLIILWAMPKEKKGKTRIRYVINNKYAGVTSPMKT